MIVIQREAGVNPGRMVPDITKCTLIERGSQAVVELQNLNDAGMLIAIDDFGTGFSSLSSLKILPGRYLNIDRCFVMELADAVAAAMIVRAVVGMGRGLSMEVIAEGVETVEQASFLKKAGCEKAQGYLFGRPQSSNDIERQVDINLGLALLWQIEGTGWNRR